MSYVQVYELLIVKPETLKWVAHLRGEEHYDKVSLTDDFIAAIPMSHFLVTQIRVAKLRQYVLVDKLYRSGSLGIFSRVHLLWRNVNNLNEVYNYDDYNTVYTTLRTQEENWRAVRAQQGKEEQRATMGRRKLDQKFAALAVALKPIPKGRGSSRKGHHAKPNS